jgi:hypothetical protein
MLPRVKVCPRVIAAPRAFGGSRFDIRHDYLWAQAERGGFIFCTILHSTVEANLTAAAMPALSCTRDGRRQLGGSNNTEAAPSLIEIAVSREFQHGPASAEPLLREAGAISRRTLPSQRLQSRTGVPRRRSASMVCKSGYGRPSPDLRSWI